MSNNLFYRKKVWYWYRLIFCEKLNQSNAYYYDDFWYFLNGNNSIKYKNLTEKWKQYNKLITMEL